MSEKSPLVSILTPVYNGETHLQECIESVLAQTWKNLEYIIVDNCSTDRTAEIAAAYARNDSRIRVVRNASFLPVIGNHNRAYAQMSAEALYCKPLMADDWMVPDCIERMVSAAQAHPSIGLVCSLAFDGKYVCWDGYPYPAHVVPGRFAVQMVLRSLGRVYFLGSPTSMLIRADLVRKRKPFYNEENLHADLESCVDVLSESDFSFVHQVLSLNRIHEKSISTLVNKRYETVPASDAYIIHKFGEKYLDPAELGFHKKRIMRAYYRLLARNLVRFGDAKFLAHHRATFQKINTRFAYLEFFGALVVEATFGAARLPYIATRTLLRRLRNTPMDTREWRV